jgi:hypothetical protein
MWAATGPEIEGMGLWVVDLLSDTQLAAAAERHHATATTKAFLMPAALVRQTWMKQPLGSSHVDASCCGPQHVSAVLGRIGKAAAVSAAPCGTGQLSRSGSSSLLLCWACCQQPSSQLHKSDPGSVSLSLAPARAVGGGTPLGLGGFLPPLDDSKGAWTNFEPSRPSPHTTPHRIRPCLSEAPAP